MKKIRIKILSWLLHHANRKYKSQEFYAIKKKLLDRFGILQGYEVQFIEGKKCYSCGGFGYHKKYDQYGFPYLDPCWFCVDGWYKIPFWSILKKMHFGKFTFHQPVEKVCKKPELSSNKTIEGYIEHKESKHSEFALVVLYLLYDITSFKNWWKVWYKMIGRGWRLYWWLPKNYINNIAHLIRHGRKAIPFQRMKTPGYFVNLLSLERTEDDLPF